MTSWPPLPLHFLVVLCSCCCDRATNRSAKRFYLFVCLFLCTLLCTVYANTACGITSGHSMSLFTRLGRRLDLGCAEDRMNHYFVSIFRKARSIAYGLCHSPSSSFYPRFQIILIFSFIVSSVVDFVFIITNRSFFISHVCKS